MKLCNRRRQRDELRRLAKRLPHVDIRMRSDGSFDPKHYPRFARWLLKG